MSKFRIGFDIDGVVLDYTTRMAEVFPLFGGKTDISAVTSFNFADHTEKSEEKSLYMAYAYMMQEELQFHKEILPLLMWLRYQRGQNFQFITARQQALSYESARKSIMTLLRWKMNPTSSSDRFLERSFTIDCIGIGGKHLSKVPLIKEYGLDYFVEDRRKNVLEISQAGITVFMPRRSWNKLPEDTPNVIQYDDSSEVVKYLDKEHGTYV